MSSALRNSVIRRVLQPFDAAIPSMPYAGCVFYQPFAEAQNLVSWSQDFSQAEWNGYCGNKTNITYNTLDVAAPDGTFTAAKWTCTPGSPCDGLHFDSWGVLQTVAPAITDDTYTTTVWLRGAAGGEEIHMGINDSHTSIFILDKNWVRYSFTDSGAAATGRGLQFFTVTAGAVYYVWGAQLEKRSKATPYTPTLANPQPGGTATKDLSGLNNDGVLTTAIANLPIWSSGPVSGALQFDGLTNYITLPTLPTVIAPYNVSFWFKLNELTREQILFSLSNSTYPMCILAGNNRLLAYCGDEKYRYGAHTFAAGELGTWFHASFDIADGTNLTNWKVYLNGVDDTGVSGANTGTYFNPGSSGYIGSYLAGNSLLNGYMSEVMVFNRVLTAAEHFELWYRTARGSY